MARSLEHAEPTNRTLPGPAVLRRRRPRLEWSGRDWRMPAWLWVSVAAMCFSALPSNSSVIHPGELVFPS